MSGIAQLAGLVQSAARVAMEVMVEVKMEVEVEVKHSKLFSRIPVVYIGDDGLAGNLGPNNPNISH